MEKRPHLHEIGGQYHAVLNYVIKLDGVEIRTMALSIPTISNIKKDKHFRKGEKEAFKALLNPTYQQKIIDQQSATALNVKNIVKKIYNLRGKIRH